MTQLLPHPGGPDAGTWLKHGMAGARGFKSPTAHASTRKGSPSVAYVMLPLTETEKLEMQLLFRRCYIGPDAAREIAHRVESEHGFWDFEERKRAHARTVMLNVVTGEGTPHPPLTSPAHGDSSNSGLAA